MLVFEKLRRAVEAAERHRLPDVAGAIWKAYGAQGLTDEQVELLDELIRARQGAEEAAPVMGRTDPVAPACARRQGVSRSGSRPRTPESMARRRRWAAAGFLPPILAASFTLGEQAVLAVVVAEVGKRGQCTLAHEHVAALAGVGHSTVRRALRLARTMGLVTSEERRVARRRNDTNVVRIVSKDWRSWLSLRLPRGAFSSLGGQIRTRMNIDKNKQLRSRQTKLKVSDAKPSGDAPSLPEAA